MVLDTRVLRFKCTFARVFIAEQLVGGGKRAHAFAHTELGQHVSRPSIGTRGIAYKVIAPIRQACTYGRNPSAYDLMFLEECA